MFHNFSRHTIIIFQLQLIRIEVSISDSDSPSKTVSGPIFKKEKTYNSLCAPLLNTLADRFIKIVKKLGKTSLTVGNL
jgi:hypothetical protein